jgi:signal transduction histidine kinase
MLAAILIVSVLQTVFFENERMRMLDQRLETIASTLIASGLSLNLVENLESTDDLIHNLLGDERVDQIINIYSLDGDVLAQNYTGSEVPLEFSPNDQWQTYDVKDRHVRVLNIKHGQLVIQVGMVLAPSVLNRWHFLNSRFALFVSLILLFLLGIAFFSSRILFSPLRQLTLELQSMSGQLDRKLGQSLSEFVIGPELSRLAREGKANRDEFQLLCAEIRSFLQKLEVYTRSFHAQTAILTHELKTPLTILKNYLTDLKSAPGLDRARELGQSATREIDRMTKLINDYLQWSVLTSNPAQPNEIFAVKLSEVAQKVVSDINSIHGQRVKLEIDHPTTVFAMPDHLNQLLSNLLSNALHYSSREVNCRVKGDTLEIEDRGPGLPAAVREHLGTPFNRGNLTSSHRSSGLGLAWVYSLCEKYRWRLNIDSSSNGTVVRVQFPG